MHDAHFGRALFFLDMLAEQTLLPMTVMGAPCLWYVVGMKLVCPMSKFPQAPFARAPFGACRGNCGRSRAPSRGEPLVKAPVTDAERKGSPRDGALSVAPVDMDTLST